MFGLTHAKKYQHTTIEDATGKKCTGKKLGKSKLKNRNTCKKGDAPERKVEVEQKDYMLVPIWARNNPRSINELLVHITRKT